MATRNPVYTSSCDATVNLSIYANNESLLKELGDAVASGEAIATTGSSGGNEETGLYFEMRHLGRAFDPLSWVKLK